MTRRKSSDDVVETLLKQVNSVYKKNALRRGSDPSLRITRVPCGVLSIDTLLSGGFARGRHVETYGSYGIGKTYLAYRLIAHAQQELGMVCAFMDVEKTFDPDFAEKAGVDIKSLIMPEDIDHGHAVIDAMEIQLRSRQVGVIVLDSIASLLPKQERERAMEQGTMGTYQARLMSEALRRLTAANRDTVLFYINQTREAVGSMFGPRQVTSGGRAMGFYSGTRLELSRSENLTKTIKRIDHNGVPKDYKVLTGHRVTARVEKDKTGGAKQSDQTTFVFDYGLGGIDPVEDVIYLGLQMGIISTSAVATGKGETVQWFVEGYEEEAVKGRNRFKKWLQRNPGVTADLEEEIRQNYGSRAESEVAD